MSIVIVAEKPSAGRDLADWLSRTQGHPKRAVGRTHIEVGPYSVTWLVGHVLENAPPHEYSPELKQWNAADLPIIPEQWKLLPKKGMSAQIRAVKSLIASASEVIGAADPDQEGQLLQDEFLIWAGNKAPTKRLWLSANDDASVAKAWAAMKSNEDYEGHYWSALARSHADWLTGINMSRACTLASQANGGNAVLTIGRVQTPTLALIANREDEIVNFKPVTYYTPTLWLATSPGFKATWNPDKEDERLDGEGRLLDKSVADAMVAACVAAGTAEVTDVKATKGRENPPLPFSLSSLQTLMSRRYGLGVQEVLNLAQSLYEKKVTTYPRTDCEYLPESQWEESDTIVASIGMSTEKLASAPADADTSLKSRAFNDKRITAHHAIVPRPITRAQLAALTDKEQVLWMEIAKRYLLQFFPAAEFLSTEILLECATEPFKATGKVYTSLGWKAAFTEEGADEGEEEEEKGVLPKVEKGNNLPVEKAEAVSTLTKPPKRFTEGTLLNAMKSVHRFVSDPKLKGILRENIGIGTEATRANVIEELFKRKFISIKKREIHPTEVGKQLIATIPKQLSAPDMTALWQQAMDDILSSRQEGYKAFIASQSKWLTQLIGEVPTWFEGRSMSTAGRSKSKVQVEKSEHKCLTCGGELNRVKGKYGWFFGCQVESCKAIFKDEGGKPAVRTPAPTDKLTVDGVSTGDKCPKCKKGTMQTRKCGPKTRTPGKLFLSCSAFFSKGKAKCTHSMWPN